MASGAKGRDPPTGPARSITDISRHLRLELSQDGSLWLRARNPGEAVTVPLGAKDIEALIEALLRHQASRTAP